MPKINEPATKHVGPAASPSFSYLPYADANYLKTVKEAIQIIDNRIRHHKPCNAAFKKLPGARSFVDLWTDPAIWINYDPSGKTGNYGATRVGSKNITITAYALRMGRWTVAATIVHELAHVNGAGSADSAAEDVLLACMLHGLHDPAIIGELKKVWTDTELGMA